MSATTQDITPSVQPMELPALVTDDRTTLVTVQRLLWAGGLAAALAGAPLLSVAWVCPPDAPWWLMACW